MEKLSKDWITEKHIDFEYKKYILLAYLKQVEESFRAIRLYPPLAELVEHYRMACSLKENKLQLNKAFPRRLTGFDEQQFRLKYESIVNDDQMMREIESILDFSIEKFSEGLQEGKSIYEGIEEKISFESIGIVPIDTNAGYLLLRHADDGTRVYSYTVSIFEEPGAAWRGLHTSFVKSYPRSLVYTYERIKTDMLNENREWPNPACYAAETGLTIPVEETFLPIAKRMLIREVSKQNPIS